MKISSRIDFKFSNPEILIQGQFCNDLVRDQHQYFLLQQITVGMGILIKH